MLIHIKLKKDVAVLNINLATTKNKVITVNNSIRYGLVHESNSGCFLDKQKEQTNKTKVRQKKKITVFSVSTELRYLRKTEK